MVVFKNEDASHRLLVPLGDVISAVLRPKPTRSTITFGLLRPVTTGSSLAAGQPSSLRLWVPKPVDAQSICCARHLATHALPFPAPSNSLGLSGILITTMLMPRRHDPIRNSCTSYSCLLCVYIYIFIFLDITTPLTPG